MTVQHIEKEALKLNVISRSKLAKALLSSLENLSETENEILWAKESLLRHGEMVKGTLKSKPAKLVFKNARAILK